MGCDMTYSDTDAADAFQSTHPVWDTTFEAIDFPSWSV